MSLFVLTPLTTAGGASDVVDIIVETSLRPDCSFGYPRLETSDYTKNFIYVPTTTEERSRALLKGPIHKQSGGQSLRGESALASGVLHPIDLNNNVLVPFTDPIEREASSMGDSIRTLRKLIKRGVIAVYPEIDDTYIFGANALDQMTQVGNPLLFAVAQWYALMRGSLRYSFNCKTDSILYLTDAVKGPEPFVAANTAQGQFLRSGAFIDVEVPMYYVNPWRFAEPEYADSNTRYPGLKFNNTDGFMVSVTAAEDFDLSYFIGVEPTPVPS